MADKDLKVSVPGQPITSSPVVVPATVSNGGDLKSKVKQFHDDALREMKFKQG